MTEPDAARYAAIFKKEFALSDYWTETEDELPLFCGSHLRQETGRQVLEQMQRDELQRQLLFRLRSGEEIYNKTEVSNDRTRPAVIVEQLRNCHGFHIDGCGSKKNPYVMPDTGEQPSLVRVSKQMKENYYLLPHWQQKRAERFVLDFHRCVLCRTDFTKLSCHHICYTRLFCEQMRDLMTVCDGCHASIHTACKLKFPSGINAEYAPHLGWKGFEKWLLP